MSDVQLNLARKWRSQQFEQIVGQDLSIRILKNSLFLGKFFPVYLFAGQHGCGKTTTARVFAAAINCQRLSDFQQNPKAFTVPCLQCDSCKAMAQGKHPDFIEMDAASHTGVDNVRQIIEASTLLPLLGRKKIYLIDEAHMLSKAAFNAFLKILEEPPSSVFFILATTDEHKIIDTVRSRCFQLYFNAVESKTLGKHLANVCAREKIAYEPEGLDLIIKETGGSVRDALNLLEQVGFSAKRIGKEEVLTALGYLPEEVLLELFRLLLIGESAQEVVQFIQKINVSNYSVEYLWQRLLQMIRAAVWVKSGVVPDDFVGEYNALNKMVQSVALPALINLFEFFCQQEQVFLKTVYKKTFLELFLVQSWYVNHRESGAGDTEKKTVEKKESIKPAKAVINNPVTQEEVPPIEDEFQDVEACEEHEDVELKPIKQEQKTSVENSWTVFLQKIEKIEEPLLASIFKQARYEKMDEQIVLHFTLRLRLFNDALEQLKSKWEPLLKEVFGMQVQLRADFTDADIPTSDVKKKPTQSVQPEVTRRPTMICNKKNEMRGIKIDISDKNSWPLTHKLLDYFPGTVVELPEPKPEHGNE